MATLSNLTGFDHGLPANIDAEKTILGAILLDNASHSEAAEKISSEDFSLDSHQRIFVRISELIDEGRPVDLVTLSHQLSKYKELEAIGGVAYLASLTEGLPRRPVIEEYVRIVKDKSLLRRIMTICAAAIADAAAQGEDSIDVLGRAETALLEVSEKSVNLGFESIDQIVANTFGSIDKLYEDSREVTGVATGFTDLDRMTSGLQKGELIIIAARPSMGKTAFAVNICQNAATSNQQAKVAIFSLEMSKGSLVRRMLASQAWVDQSKIQKGFIGRDEVAKLNKALEDLIEANIFIDDTAGISLAEMRAKARRLKQTRGGLDLIMVDYLQLMSATLPSAGGKRFDNRVQEVAAISRGLKALAKELEVPVVALSQLSRGNEKRDDKRPLLSDLRESGSIEQDADVVAFIHREAYYNRSEEQSEADKAKSEIIIAKQRNGPTGTVYLNFLSSFTRFENADTMHDGA